MSYHAYTEETHQANGVVRAVVEGIGAGMDSCDLLKLSKGLLSYGEWLALRESRVSVPVLVAVPAKKVPSLWSSLAKTVIDEVLTSSSKSDPTRTVPDKTTGKTGSRTKYFSGNVLGLVNTKSAVDLDTENGLMMDKLFGALGLPEITKKEYDTPFEKALTEDSSVIVDKVLSLFGGSSQSEPEKLALRKEEKGQADAHFLAKMAEATAAGVPIVTITKDADGQWTTSETKAEPSEAEILAYDLINKIRDRNSTSYDVGVSIANSLLGMSGLGQETGTTTGTTDPSENPDMQEIADWIEQGLEANSVTKMIDSDRDTRGSSLFGALLGLIGAGFKEEASTLEETTAKAEIDSFFDETPVESPAEGEVVIEDVPVDE